jgi:hypothetical protein
MCFTGVAKSVTSSGFCSEAGNCALPISTSTELPWVRRSGAAPSPLKWRMSRPAPPSPRLKSIPDTDTVDGRVLAGSTATVLVAAAAVAGAAQAVEPSAAHRPTTRPATPALSGRGRAADRRRWTLVTVIVLTPSH